MPIKPAYQGEAQLVRWAESAAAGRTVTLRIDEDDVQHAFKGLKCGDQGQRLHVVCVLIDDNEEAVDPDHARRNAKKGHKALTKPAEPLPSGARAPERSEPTSTTQNTSVKRSNLAAIKCKGDEAFGIWIAETYPAVWDRHYIDGNLLTPDAANATLKEVLGIASKKELDVPGPAQDAFDRLLASFDYRDRA